MNRPYRVVHPYPPWDPEYDRTWDLLDSWLHLKLMAGDEWLAPVGLRKDVEFREFALLCFEGLKKANPDFRSIVKDMTKSQMRRLMEGYEERVRRTILPLIDAKLMRRVPEGLGSSAYFLCRACQEQTCEATASYLGEDWLKQSWDDLRDEYRMGVTAHYGARRWTATRHDDALRWLAGKYGYLSFCGKTLMFEPETGLALYLANIVRKEEQFNAKRRLPLLLLYIAFF